MSPRPTGRRPLLAAGLAALAAPALAQARWQPERPVRWIVAYPAGGGSDMLARLIGAELAKGLGQPVVIENRPGAGATLGADAAAKAAPDGHTLFSGDSGAMMNNIALFRRLPYDPVKDFRGVGLFADFPLVVAVPAASRHRSIAAYIAAARAAPGAIACGTPGIGSPHHMAVERFQKEAAIQLNLIPYRGGAPGVNDLLAGTLESMMVDIASAGGAIKGGQVRALATTMTERWRTLPDVPTLREAGLADYRAPVWMGLVVPAATPEPVVQRLGEALAQVMATPAIRNRMIEIGVEPLSSTPAEFDALMAKDRTYWVPLIRELGITLEG
ncbi:Bug family tripartite tricarboxylate transporter substrate binding protein [Paracraurococcus lichenis]|uniref:Tripartite tricarboxylate transporter substrate binding protein n=1 Tax=Paracraurococcus lichenis TaxID=3064888 RepID=A0ABT9DVX2_9PROT|nr:tripartite tricarboxylate transporter substrate binding protein [Paracraurococcus sp. LOR1-02]MDO9708056.1 tripartite tricarboxylate transporter substrate binding protein [Paracraurococcus sp. LOR1-02]